MVHGNELKVEIRLFIIAGCMALLWYTIGMTYKNSYAFPMKKHRTGTGRSKSLLSKRKDQIIGVSHIG